MSKSFWRLGFANGSVDDGAVSGNAIDGGELIIDFDDTELIPFNVANECGGSVDVDNKLINRWLPVTIVMFCRCVVIVVGIAVVGIDVDDDDANGGCTRSIFGLMMASNKNDNRKIDSTKIA